MFLPHLASRLYGTPLLLARSKLDIILSVLGNRIGWSPSVSDSAFDSANPLFYFHWIPWEIEVYHHIGKLQIHTFTHLARAE